jgi:hypothetical protein
MTPEEQGIYETTTLESIIASCKMTLNLFDTTLQDGFLELSILEGLGELRNFFTHSEMIAQIPIDLTTLSAPIPRGFVETNGEEPIRTFSKLPTVIQPNNGVNTYGSIPSTHDRSGFFKGTLNTSHSAQIVQGYIRFGSDTTDTYCQLAYRGVNFDANGDAAIPSTARIALKNYGCACFDRDRRDGSKYLVYMNKYNTEKRRLRGVYNKSTNRQIANVTNKFFVKKDWWSPW